MICCWLSNFGYVIWLNCFRSVKIKGEQKNGQLRHTTHFLSTRDGCNGHANHNVSTIGCGEVIDEWRIGRIFGRIDFLFGRYGNGTDFLFIGDSQPQKIG